jgi:hypothetical protein
MNMFDVTWLPDSNGYIAVFDNAVSSELCQRLVRDFEANKMSFSPGVTLSGHMGHVKTSADLPLEMENIDDDWWASSLANNCDQVRDAFITAFNRYMEQFVDLQAPVFFSDTGLRVQHYMRGNGFYRRHVDSVPWEVGCSNRVLAVILYLNTVDHGGSTRFADGTTVHAREGRVVMFPATWTYPHQGLVPLSDDKWIITTFIVPAAEMVSSQSPPTFDDILHH